MKIRKLTNVIALVMVMVVLLTSGNVWAMLDNEPFEFESYFNYGGAKDGVYTLNYLGIGGGKCDSNDRRFKINVTRSYNGSDWKLFSSNSRYQNTPSGRPIYGFQLGTTSAHICVGQSEFSSILYPTKYWTTLNVSYYVYAWRR